jgi:hypothetical protein
MANIGSRDYHRRSSHDHLVFNATPLGSPRSRNVRSIRLGLACSALVVTSVFLAGCPQAIDTSAVKSFAQSVATMSPSFGKIARDFYTNCVRQQEYSSTSFYSDPLTMPTAAPVSRPPGGSAGSPPPVPTPKPTLQPLSADITTDPKCAQSYEISQRWLLYNDAIVAYVQSLGALAGVTTKPTGLDKLSGQLSADGFMDAKTSAEASSFGTTLASWVFEGQQKTAISDAVKSADEPFHILVGALHTVATSYDTKLWNEQLNLQLLYGEQLANENDQYLKDANFAQRMIRRTQFAHGHAGDIAFARAVDRQSEAKLRAGFVRLTMLEQRAEWETRAAQVDSLRRADVDYNKALDDIEKTQTGLVKTAQSGGSLKDLYTVISQYVGDIQADVAQLSKHTSS